MQVTAPDQPATQGHPYMLTCRVTGPAVHVQWLLNGQRLRGDNATHALMNGTLSFNPVERNDTGRYQCVAMNAAENVTSPPHMLLVNCECYCRAAHRRDHHASTLFKPAVSLLLQLDLKRR